MIQSNQVSPWKSLVWVLVFVLLGTITGGMIGVLLSFLVEGKDTLQSLVQISAGESVSSLHVVRIIQGCSSLGMFLLPPILLGYFEHNKGAYFSQKGPFDVKLILLSIAGILLLQPVIQLVGILNESMTLPESFRSLEEWMLEQEKSAEVLVKLLLSEPGWVALLSNVLVVAVIAGVAEEALFRGALQPIFTKIFKNPHIGIWVVAAIFSAIHMQFYGFLPRMLMGGFFGYLFYWTGNIWYPILAHFVNNAGVIVQVYWIQHTGGSLDSLDEYPAIPWYGYLLAILVVAVILRQILKIVNQHKLQAYGKELGESTRQYESDSN